MLICKLPFSDSNVREIVLAAYPGARTRRSVGIESKITYHVSNYWDGGSKTESVFLRLSDMSTVSAEALPLEARQVAGNTYNLPIGDIVMQPGYAIVEYIIFCGKNLRYRIILHPDNCMKFLPTEKILLR